MLPDHRWAQLAACDLGEGGRGEASLPHRELWQRMRSVEGMATAAARFYETDLLLESGGKLRCFVDFLFFSSAGSNPHEL